MKCEICGKEIVIKLYYKNIIICQSCCSYHKKYGVFVNLSWTKKKPKLNREEYLHSQRTRSRATQKQYKEYISKIKSMNPKELINLVKNKGDK